MASDSEKVKQLCQTMATLKAALLIAHEELIFGGDWKTAQAVIKDAVRTGNDTLMKCWPEVLGPMYFGDPFEHLDKK